MMETMIADTPAASPARGRSSLLSRGLRRHPWMMVGAFTLCVFVLAAVLAPLYAGDATALNPLARLKRPSLEHLFGTDNLGRDVFARTIYGARISITVGLVAAFLAVSSGLLIGVLSGYMRRLDGLIMRLMDAVMSIPTILLAIALVSLTGGGLAVLIFAITLPKVPGIARLVRSLVLSLRERPYVEAAICGGASVPRILWYHILPGTLPPLAVQSAYVCANAVLIEAGLSFLGAGFPPDVPSWGNMIAGSRTYLSLAPWALFAPGLCLAMMILSVNFVGDGLRDIFDPKAKTRQA